MQYLYRVWTQDAQLLYVGISNCWFERMHTHEKTTKWAELADVITIQRYETREEIVVAEREAIVNENPLYNKTYSANYESKMDHFTKIKFWAYHDTPVDVAHEPLLAAIKQGLLEMGLDYRRKPARYVAYVFGFEYFQASRIDGFDCRNCEALFVAGQVESWARLVADELGEEMESWTS